MQVPLKAIGAGTYRVNWRALSGDTHRTQGSFSFKVTPWIDHRRSLDWTIG